jgi:hypothetical protein
VKHLLPGAKGDQQKEAKTTKGIPNVITILFALLPSVKVSPKCFATPSKIFGSEWVNGPNLIRQANQM